MLISNISKIFNQQDVNKKPNMIACGTYIKNVWNYLKFTQKTIVKDSIHIT